MRIKVIFISDFSLQKFSLDNNVVNAATGLVLYKLLEELGLTLDLRDVPCKRSDHPYSPRNSKGWNIGNVIKFSAEVLQYEPSHDRFSKISISVIFIMKNKQAWFCCENESNKCTLSSQWIIKACIYYFCINALLQILPCISKFH